MSNLEQNKTIAQDFINRVNEGDLDGAAALCTEDLVNHAALPTAQGRAGIVTIFTKLRTAFPDLRLHVDTMIAEGDRVVTVGKTTGTHTGTLAMGAMTAPASGRAFATDHVHVFRIAGGKLAEHWAGRDDIGMWRQLGLLERMNAAR